MVCVRDVFIVFVPSCVSLRCFQSRSLRFRLRLPCLLAHWDSLLQNLHSVAKPTLSFCCRTFVLSPESHGVIMEGFDFQRHAGAAGAAETRKALHPLKSVIGESVYFEQQEVVPIKCHYERLWLKCTFYLRPSGGESAGNVFVAVNWLVGCQFKINWGY